MQVNFKLWKKIWLIQLVTVIVGMTGCSDRPSDSQLKAWQQEAIRKNQQTIIDRGIEANQKNWELKIQGEKSLGINKSINWQQLDALATSTIQTRSPHNIINPDEIITYRGIIVSSLLEKLNIDNSTEITFVAFDSFRSNINITDLRKYSIMLALERNGKPLSRSDGGPLHLIFPYSDRPEIANKYSARYWAFYVTHIIIGTEDIKLQISKLNQELNEKYNTSPDPTNIKIVEGNTLNNLEQIAFEQTVSYNIEWPVSPVKIQGVRVRDVIESTGIKLSTTDQIIIRGKSPIHRDSKQPIILSVDEIRNCDIILATRWSKNLEPIPAKMGGPVTLAFPAKCNGNNSKRWVTFVEEIEIIPHEKTNK